MGEIPIHLLAEERARIYHRGERSQTALKEERERTLQAWQREWGETEDMVQWANKCIPECEHRQTDYFLTQVLKGHGCFTNYLKRIRKADDENCVYSPKTDTSQLPKMDGAQVHGKYIPGER
ncbi:hypothetical protein JTB14_037129 [Gonioctena quinquepunctata]|nr:hypothetical protein JTB14_037129 [Gonioctena quinquepunctata]